VWSLVAMSRRVLLQVMTLSIRVKLIFLNQEIAVVILERS
jgi:hypothetical protein